MQKFFLALLVSQLLERASETGARMAHRAILALGDGESGM